MEPTRILFICSEIAPFLAETEMGELGHALSEAMQDKGREIRAFMPRFGIINERRNQLHEVIRLSGMNLVIDDTDHPLIIKVASMPGSRTQVYFIDNEDYFQRKFVLTDENNKAFADNDERTIFFVRGVLETVKKLRWKPNIVHCQGWFTFLTALFLKKLYKDDPLFTKTKIVLALTGKNEFDEPLSIRFKEKIQREGIRTKDLEEIAEPTFKNLTKLAIRYADGIMFFGGRKHPTLEAFAKELKKPVIHLKKPLQNMEECNDFYTKMIRTK
jgi:starch synthase